MEYKPGSTTIIYAVNDNQFWRSTNDGETWSQIASVNPVSGNGGRITTSASNSSVVYVGFVGSNDDSATTSIVPLAFPLIAGAGTMTTLLSLKTEYATQNIIVGIIVNMIFVYFVLKNTVRLEKLFGKTGLNILRKAFGIILLAIAIKLFRTNTGL